MIFCLRITVSPLGGELVRSMGFYALVAAPYPNNAGDVATVLGLHQITPWKGKPS